MWAIASAGLAVIVLPLLRINKGVKWYVRCVLGLGGNTSPGRLGISASSLRGVVPPMAKCATLPFVVQHASSFKMVYIVYRIFSEHLMRRSAPDS
mgnify:CR=1 FL=1